MTLSEEWPSGASGGFVVVDVETTGLSPVSDRVIEIGLIRADESGRPIAYWQSLVNPERPVAATEVHGIHDADVAGAPRFIDVADGLIERLRGQVLVGHNVAFDRSFLEAELARVGWSVPRTLPDLCTAQLAREFLPGMDRYRLADCATVLGLHRIDGHRALADAGMTAGLLHAFLNIPGKEREQRAMRAQLRSASTVAWPSAKSSTVSTAVGGGTPAARGGGTFVPEHLSGVIAAVRDLTPEDFLNDVATVNETTFAETLLDALEDGVVSPDEVSGLDDLAGALGIPPDEATTIKQRLLRWAAREAWRDGRVSRRERDGVEALGALLSLGEDVVRAVLDDVERVRTERLARRTKPLPEGWSLGSPLRVGDRIAFSGCHDHDRSGMEERALRAGLRVTGSVSRKTSLLVTDGMGESAKDRTARDLGLRLVDPAQFATLLEFIQPPEQ